MAPAERATWLRSDRWLARSIAQPISRFLAIEASGGLLLVAAAVIALVWANSPWSDSYFDLWHTELTVEVGSRVVSEDLQHWINDGLMTLFFFVIGLEIKHEVTHGQLTSPRAAAVPIAGAIGGMVVPALLYVAINLGGDGSSGWGIPMATDIAFAVGVLALLGDRVPSELKVLLLGLAIVDDIGAILVIALFYTESVQLGWLAGGVAILVAMVLLDRARVRYLPVYVVLGIAVWFTFYESGVHATLAGVALGLLAPSRPFLTAVDADRIADELSADQAVTAAEVRDISFRIRESVPVTERLEDLLHPWTSYLVVPLFALANAGIVLSGDGLARRRRRPRSPSAWSSAWWSASSWRRRRHRAGAAASGSAGCPRGPIPPRGRHGGHRRHRLHRVDLRGGPRLRRPRPHRRGDARRAGGLRGGRRPRRRHPPPRRLNPGVLAAVATAVAAGGGNRGRGSPTRAGGSDTLAGCFTCA